MPSGIYKRKPLSLETKLKISKANSGEKSALWKGDNIGYSAVHKWIYKVMGKPNKCVECGIAVGILHWANTDHKYRRVLEDWMPMCYYCHDAHDRKYNNKFNK